MNKKNIVLSTLQVGLSVGVPILLLNSAGVPMDFGATKDAAQMASTETSNLAIGSGLIVGGIFGLRYTKNALNMKIAGIESDTVKTAVIQTRRTIIFAMFMAAIYFLSTMLLGVAESAVAGLKIVTENVAYGAAIIGSEVAASGVAVYRAYDKDMNKEISIKV